MLERRRLQSPCHAEMEEALLTWAHHWLGHTRVIIHGLLRSQAAQLRARLGVTDFTYSTRRVWRFCERLSLIKCRRVGKAASTSMASVELSRTAILIILTALGTKLHQIFNCHITGVAFSRVQGMKQRMERITLMFQVNSTSSDKL